MKLKKHKKFAFIREIGSQTVQGITDNLKLHRRTSKARQKVVAYYCINPLVKSLELYRLEIVIAENAINSRFQRFLMKNLLFL